MQDPRRGHAGQPETTPAQPPAWWRCLEALQRGSESGARAEPEFTAAADLWPEGLDRRRFLQLMGASFALAGLGACTRQPLETIVPYGRAPEDLVPGRPQYYATALTLGGYATGVLVEGHMGRPTKIEGNPEHPSSLGSTDRFAQAALLDLYDPDRSRAVLHLGRIRTWEAFQAALAPVLRAQEGLQGEGLRLLSGSITSPTVAAQMQRLRTRFPKARWHRYEPLSRDGARSGALAAFGEHVELRYDFAAADVVLALDSDFLTSGPGCVRYAYDFMKRRRVREGQYGMNRLYALESTPTPTGAVADHRLSLSPNMLLGFAFGLGHECGVHGTGKLEPFVSGDMAHWQRELGLELRQNAGRSIVVAGDESPMELHALAIAMNWRLGNLGRTVLVTPPVEVEPENHAGSLRDLVRDMRAGRVEILLVLGGNPAYDAPADLEFGTALESVPLRVHLALQEDETTELCHWHVPMTHELETWSDARAHDGTVTLQQPLIEPLYGGRSIHELLAFVAGQEEPRSYEIVRRTWREAYTGADFESFWQRSVHDGVVADTALPAQELEVQRDAIVGLGVGLAGELAPRLAARRADLTALFRVDPTVHDGRFANNGWLQELPKPWTRLTWDNAALVAPATAASLGLAAGDVVELNLGQSSLEAPVWLLPGQPEDVVTLHLGYGRRRVGRAGQGAGFDAYRLRRSAGLLQAPGLQVRKTGRRQALACTQEQHSMQGRHLVRQATLPDFRANPEFAHANAHGTPPTSLYPGFPSPGYAWGMVVDLGACIGCNACVVACNAENNIPVVGKEQVLLGRDMQWLRIARYFEGDPASPQVLHQPVLCMHCENAPCEPVCPVGATVHSKEGLNEMVYNRCVGTRYCANNCPYKVRRFNFLQYADEDTEILKMLRNPDVTVRTRGVMEKCTYCVQRINHGRIQAKMEQRTLRDGDVLTACQQVCPTDALVFGDLNDGGSKVAKLRAQPLHYGILEELNTRPRTTYLARVTNPNPRWGRVQGEGERRGH